MFSAMTMNDRAVVSSWLEVYDPENQVCDMDIVTAVTGSFRVSREMICSRSDHTLRVGLRNKSFNKFRVLLSLGTETTENRCFS